MHILHFTLLLSFSFGSPCIWTKNSVLMRRAASLSFSFLDPHSESTSSMKMIEGLCWRARSNKFFTSLGETGTDGKYEIDGETTTLATLHTDEHPGTDIETGQSLLVKESRPLQVTVTALGSSFSDRLTHRVCEGEVSQVLPSCCCQTVQSALFPVKLANKMNSSVLHKSFYISMLQSFPSCYLEYNIRHQPPWGRDVLLTLSQPLGHEVWGGHGEEGGVIGLGGHSLRQVGLPRPRRTKQKDASPRSPLACEHRDHKSVW